MTQPDETTMPDRPEKAHGDELEEVVESGAGDAEVESEAGKQG